MRLTPRQQSALRVALHRHFGAAARLWIFGSWVDDKARGGDFDVLVQTDEADAPRLVDAKLEFLADLHAAPHFEDERIDVVLMSTAPDPQPRPIQRAALDRGVALT